MTIANKTPMARKAAWSYCRRCLAVMLCCLLVFGMTVRVTPRAKAVAAAGLVAAGGWAADAVASTIGFESLIAASGLSLNINQAVQDNILNRGYDFGYALDGAISAGELSETTVAWMENTVAVFKEKGGIVSGDSFTIPADVAEEIRGWTLSNFGFADGIVQYQDYVMYGTTGAFVLTDVNWTKRPASGDSRGTVVSLGSVVPALTIPSSVDMSQSYTNRIDIMDDFYVELNWSPGSDGVSIFKGTAHCALYFHSAALAVGGGGFSNRESWEGVREEINQHFLNYPVGALSYVPADYRYYLGLYTSSTKEFWSPRGAFYNAAATAVPSTVTTTLEQTAATSKPITKDLTVTVPADLPVTDVGGYDIPVFGDITGEELTGEKAGEDTPAKNPGITAGEISQAITDALPITGAAVGDQVVGEAMTEPDSLGAVFISKFPFCIPFDIIKAIQLLAAQPVTPYWEIDFYAPLEGVGGFHAQGDTTIVIDFERLEFMGIVCRWTCMLGFIYALASGTKQLIWTA